MTIRYCSTCQTNVQVADGHCLLGHSIRLEPFAQSMTDLRSEVDKAFEEVDQLFAEARDAVLAPAGAPAPTAGSARSAAPAPGARRIPPPPPPPAPRVEVSVDEARSTYAQLWDRYDDEVPISKDPIANFSPAPRMDWGPERGKSLKRPAFRKARTQEA